MKKALLATGNALIAEASPYDSIWGAEGTGLSPTHPDAKDPSKWRGRSRSQAHSNYVHRGGRNLLGVALMEVRSQLAAADRRE